MSQAKHAITHADNQFVSTMQIVILHCRSNYYVDCLQQTTDTLVQITSGVRRNFVRAVGVKQIQLKTEGRKNGNLWAVAPQSGVPLSLEMSETRILIRLLRMYFPRNWEFGSALLKLRNFGGGLKPPISPSVRHCK
jgi:hypothetical protein